MRKIGSFEIYEPAINPFQDPSVLFCRNEDGLDWYEHHKQATGWRGLWVSVRNGAVISFSDDPTTMFPAGCTVYFTATQGKIDFGWVLNSAGDAFTQRGLSSTAAEAPNVVD